jgi:hypothetical protein
MVAQPDSPDRAGDRATSRHSPFTTAWDCVRLTLAMFRCLPVKLYFEDLDTKQGTKPLHGCVTAAEVLHRS